MKQMILYEMKSSYMVSPVHTGLVHFLYMFIPLCLKHETNNSLLNKIYKIISATSILNLLENSCNPCLIHRLTDPAPSAGPPNLQGCLVPQVSDEDF